MFLDQKITEKGIGREKTSHGTTWASPRIPDVFGMLPDVSGMSGAIRQSVPLRPSQFISFQPTQPTPSSSPRVTEVFTKERERGRLHWRRLASRLKALGFGFHIAFSSLLSRYPNPGPRPIYVIRAWF